VRAPQQAAVTPAASRRACAPSWSESQDSWQDAVACHAVDAKTRPMPDPMNCQRRNTSPPARTGGGPVRTGGRTVHPWCMTRKAAVSTPPRIPAPDRP